MDGWEREVLSMVRDRLIALGCCHDAPGGQSAHESTPPMMYPEWISCVVAKRDREAAAFREALEKIARMPSRTPNKERAQQLAMEAADIARAALLGIVQE